MVEGFAPGGPFSAKLDPAGWAGADFWVVLAQLADNMAIRALEDFFGWFHLFQAHWALQQFSNSSSSVRPVCTASLIPRDFATYSIIQLLQLLKLNLHQTNLLEELNQKNLIVMIAFIKELVGMK